MKYEIQIILLLVSLFLISQLVGLALIYEDAKIKIGPKGEKEVVHGETVLGSRPEIYGFESFLWLLGGIGISTLLILAIVWLKKVNWWKSLYYFSAFLTIALALGTIFNSLFAFILTIIILAIKVYKPNFIIHNLAQILMYAGIAILLVPLFDLKWAIALLLVISAYDFFAVYKSKHMVKMALFQAKSNLFAGISIPLASRKVKSKVKRKVKGAIIGGGDVAFPLIFSGVVMENLMKVMPMKELAFFKVLVIPFFVSAALFFLLIKGKEGKFYPGMPFITAACLLGYAVISLL